MRLCYSGAPLVLGYRRQNEESFLNALVRVFQYFGGVPRCVIFDNGKVAVKDGFGAHARKQAGYAALAAHYGFEAVFCNPASENEAVQFAHDAILSCDSSYIPYSLHMPHSGTAVSLKFHSFYGTHLLHNLGETVINYYKLTYSEVKKQS